MLKINFIILLLMYSCKGLNNESIKMGKERFKRLYISNELDTLDGYYKVKKDSFFFISKYNLKNYDTIICSKKMIKPSLLFTKKSKTLIVLRENKCNLNKGVSVYHEKSMINLIYPMEKLKNNLFRVKHKAHESGYGYSNIREFYVDEKMNIIKFKSFNKDLNNFFFYD